jgi:TP901 family phage tail tape measure protein
MAMNLDTAIKFTAKLEGTGLDQLKRGLQGLAQQGNVSKRTLDQLYTATKVLGSASQNTVAGLQLTVGALKSLRDNAEFGSRKFKLLSKDIQDAEGRLRKFEGAASAAGGTLKDNLINGLATIGLGRVTAGIVQKAAGLDAEVRKASAIEGGGNYDQLRKSIEDVARVAAGTPTQVAQLATALSRAGFTAKETSQALRGVVMGAEATSVSFEEMGSVISDVMRSFGIDTSKTSKVVDILVKSANSSNQTVLDLGEAMKYAAPVARTLGINVNDLAATMALMANNGIRGSDAGTALRTGLSRLQLAASGSNDELMGLTKGSELLAKAMKVMGADVLNAQGQLKPMDQVILSLRDNMNKLPVGQRAEIAKALFGDEAGSKFLALLNSSETQIVSMFDKIRNSGGATEETREQMRGFSDTMLILTGNIETVTNAIGDKFIAVLDPLAKGATAVLDVMLAMPKPVQDLAAAAAAAGIAVGGFVLVTKALGSIGAVAAIQGIAGALGSAALAAKGFSLALLANPIGLAVAGVVALTVAAYNMNKPFKEFVDTIPQRMGMFWDSITNDASYATSKVKEWWEDLAETVIDLVDAIQQRWSAFGEWFGGIWDGIKEVAKKALGAIGIDAASLLEGMSKIANEVKYVWNVAFDFIAKNWQKKVANMINNTNPLLGVLKTLGIADVGGAAVDAMFGQLPAAPQRRPVKRRNIIDAAALAAGSSADTGANGDASELKGAANKAAQLAKNRRQQLADADKLLATENARHDISLSANELEKIQAEYDKTQVDRRIKYLALQKGALSDQAREVYVEAQRLAIVADRENYNAKIQKLMQDQTRELYTQVGLAGALDKDLQRSMGKAFNTPADTSTFRTDVDLMPGLTGGELGTKMEELKKSLEDLQNPIKQVMAGAQAIGESFSTSFKGLIDGSMSAQEAMAGFFKSIANHFLDMASQMIAKYIEMQIIGLAQQFLPSIGGIFGASGAPNFSGASLNMSGLTGAAFGGGPSLIGSANGNVFAQNGIVPYAMGGIVDRPTLFPFAKGIGLMGEAGPEAIMPLKRGADGRLGVAGGGGGSTNVTVNVDASGNASVQGDQSQAKQLGVAVSAAVQAELVKQQRPGGILAGTRR